MTWRSRIGIWVISLALIFLSGIVSSYGIEWFSLLLIIFAFMLIGATGGYDLAMGKVKGESKRKG